MFKKILISTAILTAGMTPGVQTFAQGASQFIAPYKVNLGDVRSGFRASKLIGADVKNEAKENIGTIDDLIVSKSDTVPYFIISVGGFLGIGDHLIAVPYNWVKYDSANNVVLPGATKESLKGLPEFQYNTK